MHSWPALVNAPVAICPAAHAGSTPSSTTIGSLPPFSSSARAPLAPATALIVRPVALLPTWATTATPSVRRELGSDVASAAEQLQHPRGRQSATSAPISAPGTALRSEGLCTTVLPVTSAAARRPAAAGNGSFHGVSTATTPRGSARTRSTAPGAAGQGPTGDAQTGDRCLVQQVCGDAG